MGPVSFHDIVLAHQLRYPSAQIEDYYKLAHQAALGSEHAVDNISAARKWLVRELETMEKSSSEPLIDPISADGQILRIHLQPYLASGADPELLLDAFVKTANHFGGSQEKLIRSLAIIDQLARFGDLELNSAKISLFIEKMKSSNFPAIHHSARYQELYQPHYRVVARQFLSSVATKKKNHE